MVGFVKLTTGRWCVCVCMNEEQHISEQTQATHTYIAHTKHTKKTPPTGIPSTSMSTHLHSQQKHVSNIG